MGMKSYVRFACGNILFRGINRTQSWDIPTSSAWTSFYPSRDGVTLHLPQLATDPSYLAIWVTEYARNFRVPPYFTGKLCVVFSWARIRCTLANSLLHGQLNVFFGLPPAKEINHGIVTVETRRFTIYRQLHVHFHGPIDHDFYRCRRCMRNSSWEQFEWETSHCNSFCSIAHKYGNQHWLQASTYTPKIRECVHSSSTDFWGNFWSSWNQELR